MTIPQTHLGCLSNSSIPKRSRHLTLPISTIKVQIGKIGEPLQSSTTWTWYIHGLWLPSHLFQGCRTWPSSRCKPADKETGSRQLNGFGWLRACECRQSSAASGRRLLLVWVWFSKRGGLTRRGPAARWFSATAAARYLQRGYRSNKNGC